MEKPKKSLLYGVEYPPESGVVHYDFEMRLPMIGDNIAALEDVGFESNTRLSTAMLARCLVKLGDIPREEINFDLLNNHMVDDDYDVLVEARDELKKKRMRSSPGLPSTAASSSCSADMESQSTASPS